MPAYTVKTRCGSDTYVKRDGKTGTGGKGALVGEEVAFTMSATQDQTLIIAGGDSHADAEEEGRGEILRDVREEALSEEDAERRLGEQLPFSPQEVLRQEVHGGELREEAEEGQPIMDDCALSCSQDMPARAVRGVRQGRAHGCAPQERGLAGQQTGESNETLQGLPFESSQGETQYIVRRLTPTEAERLQGFPDGHTDIPYKGKEHPPDGPRYKALGNSMCVNVMQWICKRIEEVDEIVRNQAD